MKAGKIHLYCGEGKGKTTAAMGLALRAIGAGRRVTIVQFLKDGTSHEVQLLKTMPCVKVFAGKVCEAFVWNMTPQQKQQTTQLHNQQLQAALETPCDMLILDEICAAYGLGLVDAEKVKTLVTQKPLDTELVLTGRDPADFMMENADYITEMVKIKHPFDKGQPARAGIEY
ncbi:MAG: cob(I)yrinic acid a,c-diamide adenosyltransferase [Oscillospiraceae bacterium]|nr:cob(I)yrinic acid a,c-diamide adenosyltransferase [Oscillospiraceae bacterium]